MEGEVTPMRVSAASKVLCHEYDTQTAYGCQGIRGVKGKRAAGRKIGEKDDDGCKVVRKCGCRHETCLSDWTEQHQVPLSVEDSTDADIHSATVSQAQDMSTCRVTRKYVRQWYRAALESQVCRGTRSDGFDLRRQCIKQGRMKPRLQDHLKRWGVGAGESSRSWPFDNGRSG
nr:hypothetical protein CFP56_23980 [Quercus suber]